MKDFIVLAISYIPFPILEEYLKTRGITCYNEDGSSRMTYEVVNDIMQLPLD